MFAGRRENFLAAEKAVQTARIIEALQAQTIEAQATTTELIQ
jgi:hypothetical protein